MPLAPVRFCFVTGLVQTARQIACQHLGAFRQPPGARKIGGARGLCLPDEVPRFIQTGLLLVSQLPIRYGFQACLRALQALVDRSIVLALLVRR